VECEASLRSACLKYLIRKEREQLTTTLGAEGASEKSFSAMVFTDGFTAASIEVLAKSIESALEVEGKGSSAVQVLTNDASLDARARVMADFRLFSAIID
jgi:hypothetical protein